MTLVRAIAAPELRRRWRALLLLGLLVWYGGTGLAYDRGLFVNIEPFPIIVLLGALGLAALVGAVGTVLAVRRSRAAPIDLLRTD